MLHVSSNSAHTATQQRDDIEHIVRLVLERLQGLQPTPPTQDNATNSPGTVRLDQRLVTLEDLREHWSSMRVLELSSACIVTPAVRDELRYRGISLQRRPSGSPAQVGKSPQGSGNSTQLPELLVLLPNSNKSIAAHQLSLLGATVQYANDDCTPMVQSHLQHSHRYCVWSALRPFAALRACSLASGPLAAVQLSRIQELTAAIEQAQPNVLILDDRQWNSERLVDLVRAWTKAIPVRSQQR